MIRRVAVCVVACAALGSIAVGSGSSSPTLVTTEEQVYTVPAAGGQPQQVTRGDLAAHSPSWAPDGKRLAYVQGSHISVRELRAGSTKTIVFEVLTSTDPPAWSPNGRQIAFTALTSPEGTARISVVASTGSRVKTLASTPWGTGDDQRGPVWSPDGKLLAFCLQDRGLIGRGGVKATGDLDLAVVALNRSQKRLTVARGSEFGPGWSPDGRKVLYTWSSRDGRSATIRIVPRNANLSRLVVRLDHVWGASWSPNGTLIAFTGNRPGESRTHLYVVHPDGTGLRRLTGEVTPATPAWAPNGRSIAFGTYRTSIDVVAPDGSGRRTVASIPDADIGHLAWSPDGRTIAFDARKRPPES